MIKVDRPNAILKYNEKMGGVDLMDNHVNAYRIAMRGKKWWHPIFTWLCDVGMSNAWLIYRHRQPTKPQLDFRREVVRETFQKFGEKKTLPGKQFTYTILLHVITNESFHLINRKQYWSMPSW